MKNLFLHPFTVVSFLIFSLVFFSSLEKSSKKSQLAAETLNDLDYTITDLKSSILDLEKDLYIASSSTEIERKVREELLFQKPEEIIFILPIENTPLQEQSAQKKDTPLEQWRELLDI